MSTCSPITSAPRAASPALPSSSPSLALCSLRARSTCHAYVAHYRCLTSASSEPFVTCSPQEGHPTCVLAILSVRLESARPNLLLLRLLAVVIGPPRPERTLRADSLFVCAPFFLLFYRRPIVICSSCMHDGTTAVRTPRACLQGTRSGGSCRRRLAAVALALCAIVVSVS